MSTFKTKHFSMLAVALTLLALSGSALAQNQHNANTMFFGEGVTKINMIEYKDNINPIPLGSGTGTFNANNPTFEASPFYKLFVQGVGNTSSVFEDNQYRLGTIGKSSLKGQTLSFEIVAGAIDRCSRVGTPVAATGAFGVSTPCLGNGRNGEVNHTGGFTITRGGYRPQASVSVVTGNYQRIQVRRVQVVSLTLDFVNGVVSGLVTATNDWAEGHTGIVVGRRDIFILPNITQSLEDNVTYTAGAGSPGARSSRSDTLWVQNLEIKLAAEVADTLNAHFEDAGRFKANTLVGWANFFAVGVPTQELPNYTEWVYRY